MESCDRVGAHNYGGSEQWDNILTDLFSMLHEFGLFAVHGNTIATQEAEKDREKAQIY